MINNKISLTGISDFFNSQYKANELNIKIISWLIIISNICYCILFSFAIAKNFDSILLRSIGVIILLPFLFKKQTNDQSQKLFSHYWFFCLFYNLSFLTNYLAFINNFSGIWIVFATVAIFLTIFVIANFFAFLAFFISGNFLAFIISSSQNNSLKLDNNLIEYLLALPFILVVSYIFITKINPRTLSAKTDQPQSEISQNSEENKEKIDSSDQSKKNQNSTKPDLAINNITESENFKKVLIIDDQEINIKICQKLINSIATNTEIKSASNGEQALVALKDEKQFDLIITDIQMPVMNGFELSKKIREKNIKTPIVAYTSRSSYQSELTSLSDEINDYIIKPIPNLKFERVIHKWLVNEHQYNYDIEKIANSFKDLQILIADDEQVNNMMLSKFLSKYNINIETVNDGDQLIEKYRNELETSNTQYNNIAVAKYDILIIDLNMPNVNGFDATKQIRQLEITKNIQNKPIIIAYSADDKEENLNLALKSGMDDYFIKGSDNLQLIKMIYHWLFFNQNLTNDNSQFHNYKKFKSEQTKSLLISSKLSPEELKEFKEIFVASTINLVKKIIKSANDKNIEDLAFHSHALKGISGNIGAEKIYEYCKIINDSAKKGVWPYEQDWIDQLKIIVKNTFAEIDRIINQ